LEEFLRAVLRADGPVGAMCSKMQITEAILRADDPVGRRIEKRVDAKHHSAALPRVAGLAH